MWLFGITCTRRMSSKVAHNMKSRLSTIPSWYFYKTFDWFNFWLTRFKSSFIQANILTLSRLQLMHNLSCKFWSSIFIFILLFVFCQRKFTRPKVPKQDGTKMSTIWWKRFDLHFDLFYSQIWPVKFVLCAHLKQCASV